MTIRTETLASISTLPSTRNAPHPSRFPALTTSRARGHHAGPALAAVVWMLVLAFFVLAVAAPAAVMERHAAAARAEATRVAQAGR